MCTRGTFIFKNSNWLEFCIKEIAFAEIKILVLLFRLNLYTRSCFFFFFVQILNKAMTHYMLSLHYDQCLFFLPKGS